MKGITTFFIIFVSNLSLGGVPAEYQENFESLQANLIVPDQCIEEGFDQDLAVCIKAKPVCDGSSCLKGYVSQTLYVIVEKELYPTVDDTMEQFLSFDNWVDGCSSDCDNSVIKMNSSQTISMDRSDESITFAEQYMDFEALVKDGVINLGWHRMVTYTRYWGIQPLEGQLRTVFFAVDGDLNAPPEYQPSEGMKYQIGMANVADYNEDYWLVTYTHDIRITKDIMPNIGAKILNKVLFNIMGAVFDWDFAVFDRSSIVYVEDEKQ